MLYNIAVQNIPFATNIRTRHCYIHVSLDIIIVSFQANNIRITEEKHPKDDSEDNSDYWVKDKLTHAVNMTLLYTFVYEDDLDSLRLQERQGWSQATSPPYTRPQEKICSRGKLTGRLYRPGL